MIALDDVPPAVQPALAQIRHLFGCHLRHCAGRPRASADLLHLREIIDRLDEVALRVTGVASLCDALPERVVALGRELERCEAARHGLRSDAERAGALAALASQQLLLYRRLFAGRARLTRRRELLHRLYINLTMILHEM